MIRHATTTEVGALEAELVVLWARCSGGTWTGTAHDLVGLQRAVDMGRIRLSSARDIRALGIALGSVLARELALHWVVARFEPDRPPELALASNAEHSILVRPLSMVEKRVAMGDALELDVICRDLRELVEAKPRPAANRPAPAWRSDLAIPGTDALARRLGELAGALHAGAELAQVIVRGARFAVWTGPGPGLPGGASIHVSFAGERAVLVLIGGEVELLAAEGPRRELLAATRAGIAQAIDDHLAACRDHAAQLPILDEQGIDDLFSEMQMPAAS